MAINPGRTAQLFLESLVSEGSKSSFEYLLKLTDDLENKLDPDPIEVKLLENIYHFLEKLKILEGNLRSYSKQFNKDLPGNKLSDLYDLVSSDRVSSLNE